MSPVDDVTNTDAVTELLLDFVSGVTLIATCIAASSVLLRWNI